MGDEKKVTADGAVEPAVTETVEKEVEALKPRERDEIDELLNTPIPVSIRGVEFKVCSIPMREIPKLQARFNALTATSLEDPDREFTPEEIRAMAEIIYMGVKQHHPRLTVERLELLPLGAVPKLIMAVMDLADFFGDMRTLSAAQAIARSSSS